MHSFPVHFFCANLKKKNTYFKRAFLQHFAKPVSRTPLRYEGKTYITQAIGEK